MATKADATSGDVPLTPYQQAREDAGPYYSAKHNQEQVEKEAVAMAEEAAKAEEAKKRG